MTNRLFVGTRKGVFTLERAANRWRVVKADFLSDNCTMLMRDPRHGHVYVALDHGHFGTKLHRSDDDGATWHEITTPTYPEPPAGYELKPHPMSGKPIPWSLKMIWALEPGGADQPGRLWCGTLPGGLFMSDDHGETWAINRPLWDRPEREQWFGGGFDEPGIHSVCVDPRSSHAVTVGVSCGGAWHTDDDGATWTIRAQGMRAEYMPPEQAYDTTIQDPHLIVQCAADPETMWTQHHNGIFRTRDRGRSWDEIANARPSSFGFAVAVHPREPDTAWFVPAIKDEHRIPVDGRLVVTRTRDGGSSFDVLDRGLPGEHAYDLVYRHALDIDAAGDGLAFGSTTGNLWFSGNQGDSWETVSTSLPPVHVVRFTK